MVKRTWDQFNHQQQDIISQNTQLQFDYESKYQQHKFLNSILQKNQKRLKLEKFQENIQNFEFELKNGKNILKNEIQLPIQNNPQNIYKSKRQKRLDTHNLLKQNKAYRIAINESIKIQKFPLYKLKKCLLVKKQNSFSQKIKVIEERFGQYGCKEQIYNSYQQISNKLGMKLRTVISIVQTYLRNGCKIYVQKRQIFREKLINQQIKKFILSKTILTKWASFSLQKRCQLIHKQFGVQISRFTLANCYKENKIRYIKPQYSLSTKTSEQQMIQNRLEFIQKIIEYLADGKEIIYLDECSTHCWEKRSKMWTPTNEKINLKLQSQRGQSLTIIGAITSERSELFYNLVEKTNQQSVKLFLELLEVKIGLKGKVIVMDNHTAHWSTNNRQYLIQQEASILFLPSSTSIFNPVEVIWNWIKSKWRNQLMVLNGQILDYDQMKIGIKKICDSIPKNVVRNISSCCIKIMANYLEQNTKDFQ